MDNKTIIAGILGAIILGLLFGIIMMYYGANNGCFFLEGGYETCGPIGLVIGVILGFFIGIKLVDKFYKNSMDKSFKPNLLKIVLSVILAYISQIVAAFVSLFLLGMTDSFLVSNIVFFLVSLPSLPNGLAIFLSNVFPNIQILLTVVGFIVSVIWTYILICLVIFVYNKYKRKGRKI